MSTEKKWDWELTGKNKKFNLGLKELWNFRGLIQSFVRRELIAGYQQTIMGLFWLVLQPLLTTLFYLLVFGRIVRVSTDGVPPLLFFMSGSIVWSFFSDCLTSTMFTFIHNAHIFSKVYFPRLVVPLSMIATHSFRFAIQFTLFLIIYLYYWITGQVHPTFYIILVPLILITSCLLSMGLGMMISIYMARYRDLEPAMTFIIRLFMFITPVVYPASLIPSNYKLLFWLNPLTPIIEVFRSGFFYTKSVSPYFIISSVVITMIIFTLGLILFKKRELTVMDTI